MSTPDNRRAKLDSTPKEAARGGADPDQANARPSPNEGPLGRPDPQQPSGFPSPNAQTAAASNVPEQQGPKSLDTHDADALLLWDPVLQTLADGLADVEATRIAQGNRYRILTTTAEDSDGAVRGFGLGVDHPAVAALASQLQTLEFLDAQMTKALERQFRAHPLYPWVKATKGLGAKTVARLLGAIHDPYWNELHSRPRTVGELFAYCGVAGPGQRRTRGQKSNWDAEARKRLWIITGPIIRGDGPYRAVYDAARQRYTDKSHTAPCAQCGVKGNPALVGSEWRDGHKHAGAVRLVMREILRDLWTEACRLHEDATNAEATEAGAA